MSVLGPFIGGERSFGIRRAEAVVDRSNGVRLERVCATLWRYENSHEGSYFVGQLSCLVQQKQLHRVARMYMCNRNGTVYVCAGMAHKSPHLAPCWV